MANLLLKVCGMRDHENVTELSELNPDFIGFIFYPSSPRYVGTRVPKTDGVRRVGVFVNARPDEIFDKVTMHDLDYVQLHGQESVQQCHEIARNKVKIIKAFSVDDAFDFSLTSDYNDACEYFVFDTRGTHPGGNARQFNWSILNRYRGSKPFLLSGGIGPEDIEKVKAIKHKRLAGIDVNSMVEIQHGLKNIDAIKRIQQELNREKHE